jgi:hypothetical protein
MLKSARIAPPNSLLVVSDIEGGDAPQFITGEPVLSTPSCLTVGCLTFADGETEVRLAPASEFSDRGPPRWDQGRTAIATPTTSLSVWIEQAVAGDVSCVSGARVWSPPRRVAQQPGREGLVGGC